MNQKTFIRQKLKQGIIFAIGFAILIYLDQVTKFLAVEKLKDQIPYVIWDGVFELRYLENRGAAFGMLQGKQGFFFIVAAIVLVGAGYILYKMPYDKKYLPMGACILLITSGAVGNMIDRLAQSFVVDFLYFKLIDFPIFNVADCYVTIGTAILAVLFLIRYKEEDLEVFSFKKKGEPHCSGN